MQALNLNQYLQQWSVERMFTSVVSAPMRGLSCLQADSVQWDVCMCSSAVWLQWVTDPGLQVVRQSLVRKLFKKSNYELLMNWVISTLFNTQQFSKNCRISSTHFILKFNNLQHICPWVSIDINVFIWININQNQN